MQILFNIESRDKSHAQYLNYLLSKRGMTGAITTKAMSSDELYALAKAGKCDGIAVAHPKTLENLVTAPEKAKTLDNFRGTRIILGNIPCVIINPLWHTTKVPSGRFIFDCDLDKLTFGTWKGPKIEGEFIGSTARLPAIVKEISEAVLVAVDIETNGEELDKFYSRKIGKETLVNDNLQVKPVYITSIGYTLLRKNGTIYSYVIPVVDFNKEYWSFFELQAVYGFIRKSVATGAPLVFHNGLYDVLHLIQVRAFVQNWVWDTMGAQHAWYVELAKDLGFTTSLLCPDYRQWKFEGKMAGASQSIETLLGYNMKDTYWTLRCAMYQMQHMPQWAKDNFYKTFKMWPSSMYCHFEGMNINNDVRIAEHDRREAIFKDKLRMLKVMTGNEDFNPGSWPQLEHLFYTVLGARKPNIGKSKSCTDEKNLKAVAEQHPLLARYVKEILEYKAQSKALGTYFRFRQRNGKLMYQLSPWVTDTGRFASQASSFNCGTQVQNIPYYAKSQFIPEDGWVWVNIDYSKVEAVITAYLSQATKLIKAVTDPNKDFYKTLGTLFFNIPYEEVTSDFRNKVLKKIVHGSNYMMQGRTFVENAGADNLFVGAKELGITITEQTKGYANAMTMIGFANMLLEKYHEPFPEVRRWYAETKQQLLQSARITSPTGYTRLFFGDASKDHSILRAAVAHQPQGWAGELMKYAVKDIFDKMVCHPDWIGDIRFKAQVHDSWVGVVRRERLEEALPILAKYMCKELEVHGRKINVAIDIEISTKSYGELTELHYDRELGKYILPDVF